MDTVDDHPREILYGHVEFYTAYCIQRTRIMTIVPHLHISTRITPSRLRRHSLQSNFQSLSAGRQISSVVILIKIQSPDLTAIIDPQLAICPVLVVIVRQSHGQPPFPAIQRHVRLVFGPVKGSTYVALAVGTATPAHLV